MGVDAATGAALDHYPNPAHIDLKPIGSKVQSQPGARKPSKAHFKREPGKPTA